MCCGQMQSHGLSVEGREHWYLCPPGVIIMTLGSSLSSFIWCHVIKNDYVVVYQMSMILPLRLTLVRKGKQGSQKRKQMMCGTRE
jgi:hypothetical protein